MYMVFNSTLLAESDFTISANDRAFQYGDGLFETIRYEDNRIVYWPDHYDRLTQGMAALQLAWPNALTAELLHAELLTLLAHNRLINRVARIKIQVWRQPGGLYTPTTNAGHRLLMALPGNPFAVSQRAQVGIFDDVRLSPSVISAYKTTSALPYVLAGLARQARRLDELILLDTFGHVAECVASALFWLRGNEFFLPSLKTGCIDGILRRQLIRMAPEMGFGVREGLFLPKDLGGADAVFCGNVMGIQWLNAIDGIDAYPQQRVGADVMARLLPLFEQMGK